MTSVWPKNLLFVGVVAAGVVTFIASLLPRAEPKRAYGYRPQVAAADDFAATLSRVDEAFKKIWAPENLKPADRAGDLQIARRVSLALTGTVPSLEEIRHLESLPVEGRIAAWTSHLLGDSRYHDYFAERLARAYVGSQDGPFLIFRRRRFVTWLAEQLKENRPYNQLVQELIASEGLWTSEPAANFITAAFKPGDDNNGPDESALAARVSRAFLGIRLDCAECHDHPFDRWKQEQFHQLAAFFGPTENSITGIRDGTKRYRRDDDMGNSVAVSPAVPFHAELLPERGKPRRRLAEWATHPKNEAFSRATVNRVWTLLVGRALVEPVDNLKLDGECPEPLEILAADFVEHDFDLQRLVQLIVNTRVFQLDSRAPVDAAGDPLPGREITEAHEEHWGVFPITRLRAEQVAGAVLQASSLATIDYDSHIVVKFIRESGENEFVKRYGDAGEDELQPHGGTIPQRLLMMNGQMVRERIDNNPVTNATTHISLLAPDDASAVESAFLTVLTRRPSAEEAAYFVRRLGETRGEARRQAIEDLYWGLVNSTEFSWNH
jgi:hypothetical protein